MERELSESEKRLYLRALEAVKRRRVVKFKFKPSGIEVWCVYSKKRERLYLVIPKLFCSCTGFLMNVILTRRLKYCYHMLAQEIAEKENKYEVRELPDDEFIVFLRNLMKHIVRV